MTDDETVIALELLSGHDPSCTCVAEHWKGSRLCKPCRDAYCAWKGNRDLRCNVCGVLPRWLGRWEKAVGYTYTGPRKAKR